MNQKSYPSFADYQSALQNPERAFSANFLRRGEVEIDLWGFPRVRSGGFALTYKVAVKETTYAARCFHRAVRDRSIRYARICAELEAKKLAYFVSTRYILHGILVQGKHFPISVLEWVEGESLESFVFHNLGEKEKLLQLAERFRVMCRDLEDYGIAHGDLSHRNIIVRSGDLYLIDYDGMYVPGLSGRKSSELGNIHFQHPGRTNAFFDSRLDRFSSIVIYLALLALGSDSSLWNRFQSGGEGLIFQKSDFQKPSESLLLNVLEKNSHTSRFIPRFRQICLSSVEEVPALKEIILGHKPIRVDIPQLWNLEKMGRSDSAIVSAENSEKIRKMAGQVATIVGNVTEVFHGRTPDGKDHIFINFGDWRQGCFTCVLWGTVLTEFLNLDTAIDEWVGQWLRVRGLITVRNNRPQIQVEMVTDCSLMLSEEKAQKLLGDNLSNNPAKGELISKSAEYLFNHKLGNNEKTSFQQEKSFPEGVSHLDNIFSPQKDTVVEDVINQLYSSKHFKTRKKRK